MHSLLLVQSGNWTVDQAFYGRPEDIDILNRPYYSMLMATGAADLASQMVAAFAASAIVWRGVDDGYSDTLLTVSSPQPRLAGLACCDSTLLTVTVCHVIWRD